MQDMRFLRDMVVGGGRQAVKHDPSEELMRLAQDPLLLHAHLHSRDCARPDPAVNITDGRLETQLQKLAERPFDRRSVAGLGSATSRYSLRDAVFEPSLHPEVFVATGKDKEMAIDEGVADKEDAMPPNLVGGILIACGIFFLAISVADMLAFGWAK